MTRSGESLGVPPNAKWARARGVRNAALLLVALLALAPDQAIPGQDAADPRLGRVIYRAGRLPSGRPLRAEIAGGAFLSGEAASCASCHRPSGFGGVEGREVVPPVTAPALFGEGGPLRSDLLRELFQEELSAASRGRLRAAQERPPYTDAALATALREGRDPAGRLLDPLMPRYRLTPEEMGHLAAYLRTLSAAPDPGVDGTEIHFATVIAGPVEDSRRRALLDVLTAYFRFKNAEVDNRLSRPWPRIGEEEALAGGYRRWVLHVWDLAGPAEGWPAEMDRRYRERPVFAVLGGLGVGSWRPVHEFCESIGLPCLFPETALPVASPAAPEAKETMAPAVRGLMAPAAAGPRTPAAGGTSALPAGGPLAPPSASGPGHWTVYLSQGLAGEAEALARHLREGEGGRTGEGGKPRVLQVYRDEPAGREPAQALRRTLAGSAHVEDRVLQPGREDGLAAWISRQAQGPRTGSRGRPEAPAVLVLWLPAADLSLLPAAPGAIRQLYLSATLLEEAPPSLPEAWRERTLLTWRRTLPGREGPHARRARAWLRARGIEPAHEPLQLDTWFTLSLLDHALMHMAERHSRELLLEEIERETEREPNPGVFPALSLGPGQRFASKGCYLVRSKPGAPGGIEPAGGWIVP